MNNDDFIYQNMMTCIGNKRKLIDNIEEILLKIKKKLKKNKLNILDGFTGSTVVARMFSYHAENLYTNDLEKYSYIMSHSFLTIPSNKNKKLINEHIKNINNFISKKDNLKCGLITKNYCPKNSNKIKKDERCFYTKENGLIIDTINDYINNKIDNNLKYYILSQLLIKASIHTNTSGIFKAFYKDKNTGIGIWGGTGQNALTRIKKTIKLDEIIWNNTNTYTHHNFNEDINLLIKKLDNLDVIYLDPPYNQHPYGSNYFMLNLITNNKMPENISKISGIPTNWNRSNYNYKDSAIKSLTELLILSSKISKYIILSYNNEGIINNDELKIIFKPYKVQKFEILYDTFKGCRNLKNRNNKVIEIIYLISK